MKQRWQIAGFGELGNTELYEILKLRQEVFAVEQNCVYQDADGLDPQAIHIACWEGETLLAYQRCLPPGLQQPESALGRIVVAPSARGRNLGRELVRRGIAHNLEQWPAAAIRIHAQAHLERFYNDLGFATDSAPYQLDGIPHLEMVLARPPA
ncbi:GNAT family N-acetyltransferase [Seongchinamella unica]|uniref:GNAT family N-acetyltransferase n=1 Tax=Seongchinamella unica TaxID=2547392 RepID=A0A4R5LW10_9GAMM|nr:GNAT family N-acetyltransferase [Seongchinamella unica]TDG15610.1 GNAT family N-acetyltransferase [Seongchinamella unica]